jgi:hypothetical protein
VNGRPWRRVRDGSTRWGLAAAARLPPPMRRRRHGETRVRWVERTGLPAAGAPRRFGSRGQMHDRAARGRAGGTSSPGGSPASVGVGRTARSPLSLGARGRRTVRGLVGHAAREGRWGRQLPPCCPHARGIHLAAFISSESAHPRQPRNGSGPRAGSARAGPTLQLPFAGLDPGSDSTMAARSTVASLRRTLVPDTRPPQRRFSTPASRHGFGRRPGPVACVLARHRLRRVGPGCLPRPWPLSPAHSSARAGPQPHRSVGFRAARRWWRGGSRFDRNTPCGDSDWAWGQGRRTAERRRSPRRPRDGYHYYHTVGSRPEQSPIFASARGRGPAQAGPRPPASVPRRARAVVLPSLAIVRTNGSASIGTETRLRASLAAIEFSGLGRPGGVPLKFALPECPAGPRWHCDGDCRLGSRPKRPWRPERGGLGGQSRS